MIMSGPVGMTGRLAAAKVVTRVQEQTRRLVLMRHAKAEQDGATDYERALTGAGRADAAGGRGVAARPGGRPDHALVSDARAPGRPGRRCRGAGWELEPELARRCTQQAPTPPST